MSEAVAAIILAAGESQRMGEPKALLDWGGRPLLQHQIDELLAAGCTTVVVVLGAEADEIRAQIHCDGGCKIVLNADYAQGRASSVRRGAETAPNGAAALVMTSVDQPLRASTVRRLVEALRESGAAIVVPRYERSNGHPVVFDGRLLGELRGVTEADKGMRAVRAAHTGDTYFLEVNDAWVTLNLNDRTDYERAAPP